ncbi:ribonuclease D [Nocardioides daphniae]|uniref:3'-5' exonuclease n=1 Tax=Nocardioides daphniae TaxID=402297 RepID=A0ABQ1PWQ4_9ACTN|nr:ribonuclease D [Nocardioides daphniae]GGD05627.1 3'-5' exonuclease [Nocardioides daphniae]
MTPDDAPGTAPTEPDPTGAENTDAQDADAKAPDAEATPPPPAPLLTLSGGIPDVVDTPSRLEEACAALAGASGPVALDAERASGYRYSQRAYLIQLRRGDSGTWLIDPIAFDSDLPTLAEALGDAEWILHAATQDLPCLREVGLEPTTIFDTELAGRLLGMPRVGLATLVEEVVGLRMRKEHSAADWSKRPLPNPWLEYAALDVEVLVELRDHMQTELEKAGKWEWAQQEFTHLLDFQPTVRVDAWRRVSGLHKLRGRRALAVARALWETRDEIARTRDVTPGRVIPDAALVAAATAMPANRNALLATRGFHGRGAERYANRWMDAIAAAMQIPEDELPPRTLRGDGPPPVKAWADRDPVADRRYKAARDATLAIAEEHHLPVENLITPDYVRRAMWTPPSTRDPEALTAQLREQLMALGARRWQVDLVLDALVDATLRADEPVAEQVAGTDEAQPEG